MENENDDDYLFDMDVKSEMGHVGDNDNVLKNFAGI